MNFDIGRIRRRAAMFACSAAAAASGVPAHADFVRVVVTVEPIVLAGCGPAGDLLRFTIAARFDGPEDTVVRVRDLVSLTGAEALSGFWHKDLNDCAGGCPVTIGGWWGPRETGSAINRPYDSFVVIGGSASATNTTIPSETWQQAQGVDCMGSTFGWYSPELPSVADLGWENPMPQNLQGTVGHSPGLPASDVRLAQLVLSAEDVVPRTYQFRLDHVEQPSSKSIVTAFVQFSVGACPMQYRDSDGDGFGRQGEGVALGCDLVSGFQFNDLDCNDSSAAINPNTTWYRDVDGDGVGEQAAGTLVQCIQPAGYALVNGDNCPGIANPDQADCNENGMGDACEIAAGQNDCNSNGLIDSCEIASGMLTDCDGDGRPDICEGAITVAEQSSLLPVAGATAAEHVFTSLPRVADGVARVTIEATADLGGATDGLVVTLDGGSASSFFVADGTDCPSSPNLGTITLPMAQANALVADGSLVVRATSFGAVNSASCANGGVRIKLTYVGLPASSDCNGNGLLDSCEVGTGATPDCNGNGLPDSCDIAAGAAQDCNSNGRPDSCDIASGASSDLNGNGRPDECAGELVVGGTGFGTMQAAHNAAATGATIWIGPGVRNEPLSLAKRVTLRGTGGPGSTILEGVGLNYSIIYCVGNQADGAVIDGLTFRNGQTGTEIKQFCGGAIAMVQSNLTIRNCVFTGNHSDWGGAIYGVLSSSTIENCTFTANSSSLGGAAVCFEGGGGWTLRNCSFASNSSAGVGGAVHLIGSGGSIELCSMESNDAIGMGGGVSWRSQGSAPVTVAGCTMESNVAAAGGALAVLGGTGAFAVSNSRICRNLPSNFAGAVQDLGGNTLSTDCNANGVCDADEIASGGAADCNANGVIDWCDLASGSASDCDFSGIPDSCEIASGALLDCNLNGVPDGCDLASGTSLDCNGNSVPDSCDIANRSSYDVDTNGIPDECKPDCDGDGVPDAWELLQGLDSDCNGNATIDRCEIAGNGALDCNGNVIPDLCELAANPTMDCNGNGRIDTCDIAANAGLDCNSNGKIDACELAQSGGNDCDGNGAIDSCEIASNAGLDKNGNGHLDICELGRGDLNLDGTVNAADLAVLLAFWGVPQAPVGDLNGDGAIGGADLAIMLGNWGTVG